MKKKLTAQVVSAAHRKQLERLRVAIAVGDAPARLRLERSFADAHCRARDGPRAVALDEDGETESGGHRVLKRRLRERGGRRRHDARLCERGRHIIRRAD